MSEKRNPFKDGPECEPYSCGWGEWIERWGPLIDDALEKLNKIENLMPRIMEAIDDGESGHVEKYCYQIQSILQEKKEDLE